MAVDFSKILQKQASAIEKPKPLPIGSYVCNNPALPKFQGLGKNESAAAIFGLVVLAPGDDVDPQQLTEFGEWKGKTIRHTQWLSSDAAEYHAKEELVNAFALEEGDKTLGQLYNETVNKQVLVKIKHRPSDDGTEMFHEVESLAAV